jgi:hypothetical protein
LLERFIDLCAAVFLRASAVAAELSCEEPFFGFSAPVKGIFLACFYFSFFPTDQWV